MILDLLISAAHKTASKKVLISLRIKDDFIPPGMPITDLPNKGTHPDANKKQRNMLSCRS